MMHKEIRVRVQVPGQGRFQGLVMFVYPKEIRARVHLGGRQVPEAGDGCTSQEWVSNCLTVACRPTDNQVKPE